MQVYYLGDGGQRGAYYFYAREHKGWVVADLDTNKVHLVDQLLRLDVDDDAGVTDILNKIGLAQASDRWLVEWLRPDTNVMLRDHLDELDGTAFVIYDDDGQELVVTANLVASQLGDMLRKLREGAEKQGHPNPFDNS